MSISRANKQRRIIHVQRRRRRNVLYENIRRAQTIITFFSVNTRERERKKKAQFCDSRDNFAVTKHIGMEKERNGCQPSFKFPPRDIWRRSNFALSNLAVIFVAEKIYFQEEIQGPFFLSSNGKAIKDVMASRDCSQGKELSCESSQPLYEHSYDGETQ